MIWVFLENHPAIPVTRCAHAHTLQWGEVQQANSIYTKAHSHSILIGGRPLSFWLDRGLPASQKTKHRFLWGPSPTQGKGEHSYIKICTPYNFNRKYMFWGDIWQKSMESLSIPLMVPVSIYTAITECFMYLFISLSVFWGDGIHSLWDGSNCIPGRFWVGGEKS